jgi:hypothetical protein
MHGTFQSHVSLGGDWQLESRQKRRQESLRDLLSVIALNIATSIKNAA